MAGERSFFFDGDDKLYNSSDFAQLFDMFFWDWGRKRLYGRVEYGTVD
ncbi:hypothetical protein ACT7DP_28670 [Bacillus paranthracis]